MLVEENVTDLVLGTLGNDSKQIKDYHKRLRIFRRIVASEYDEAVNSEYFFELEGGYRFFFQKWLSIKKEFQNVPKGLFLFLHEAYGSSDIFHPLADMLCADGYMAIALDYRGHGRTGGYAGGLLGDIDNFKMVIEDSMKLVLYFLRQYDIPLYIVGYDIGALIAVQMTAKNAEIDPAGLVFISPVYRLRKMWKHAVLYPLIQTGKIIAGSSRLQRVFPEKISDTYYDEYRQYTENNPFRLKTMSLRMFQHLLDLINGTRRFLRKLYIPLLVFQGTDDDISDPFGTQKMYANWKHPNKKIRVFDHTGHNILADKFTGEIFEEILVFLKNT